MKKYVTLHLHCPWWEIWARFKPAGQISLLWRFWRYNKVQVLFPSGFFPTNTSWTDRQTAPHSRYVKEAFKDRLLANCIIFAGVCTPLLVHFTHSDSITMGAEMAAAGWVMPSLNSSAILVPGFWFLSATHWLRVRIYAQSTQFCTV